MRRQIRISEMKRLLRIEAQGTRINENKDPRRMQSKIPRSKTPKDIGKRLSPRRAMELLRSGQGNP